LELPFTDIEEIEPKDKKENALSFGGALELIGKARKPNN
jgi:hypothetical protein